MVVTNGGDIHCRAAIIATDPSTAATLLPQLPKPDMRGLTTFYFGADQAPIDEPTLLLDGDRREIVANTTVVSNAAPEYAPAGKIPDRGLLGRRRGPLGRLGGGHPGRTGPNLRHPN
nr:hypothetical protein GCM10020092_090540 [Actinoplanes digitatis]